MGGEAEESALGINPFPVLLAGTLCIVSGRLLGVVLISAWPLRGAPTWAVPTARLEQREIWSSKATFVFLFFRMHLPQKPCSCLSL